MIPIITHQIQENSAFFQGNPEQFFSKGIRSYLIERLWNDDEALNGINIEKFRRTFVKTINTLISRRNQGAGGTLPLLQPFDLNFKSLKFIDDKNSEGKSGIFTVFPNAAMCPVCNHYFVISKGKKCGHDSSKKPRQVTFIAVCDECGLFVPLHRASNLLSNCPGCNEENGLSILNWRDRNDFATYSIKCHKCGHVENLIIYFCNHKKFQSDDIPLSLNPPRKYRITSAKAGAVLHPYIIVIPDIPQEGELDRNGRRNTDARVLAEAINEIFGPSYDESVLYLPEFRSSLENNTQFWALDKIDELSEMLGLDCTNYLSWSQEQFLKIIKTLLKVGYNHIKESPNPDKIKTRFGLYQIQDVLETVKAIDYSEKDLQGDFLNSSSPTRIPGSSSPVIRNAPLSFNKNYDDWIKSQGLIGIRHISNINLVQAMLGNVAGSTRRDPIIFSPIYEGKRKTPTVYVRQYQTEGILFQLDHEKLINWILDNQSTIKANINLSNIRNKDEITYRKLVREDPHVRIHIETLLHTYCHLLIQQSSIFTGLDNQSLSEIIYPIQGSFFIYSTNAINIGGLEFTYDNYLSDWFSKVFEFAYDCPQDPGCLYDEGGACIACSYLPEFVCERFNHNLDRATLRGRKEGTKWPSYQGYIR
jgi:hypothetical protein